MVVHFLRWARWCAAGLGFGVLGQGQEIPAWLGDAAHDPSTCESTHLLQVAAGARRSGVDISPFDEYALIAPADVATSMASQFSCSCLQLAGRDEAQFRRTEWKTYALKSPVQTQGEDPVVVSASFRNASTSYAYHGKHFGCQRVEGLQQGLEATHSTLSQASESIDKLMAGSSERSGRASPPAASPAAELPQAVLDFVETAIEDPTMYTVLVSYRGTVVEHYNTGEGFSKDSLLHGWSMAKSILSLLLGARSAEGKLDVSSFVDAPEISNDEKLSRNMTIASLLSMRVGKPLDENVGCPPDLWQAPSSAAYAITGPRADKQPGEFYYASGNSNLNSRELRRSFEDGEAGLQEYLQYPWAALFSRIGASSFACELDPASTFVFSSFCYGTARDYMKLAELVLSKGAWGDEQIVPKEWMDWTTDVVPGDDPEYARGWWHLEHRYPGARLGTPVIAALGTLGQFSMAIPEHDLVITRLGSLDGATTSWFGPAEESQLHQLLTALREGS